MGVREKVTPLSQFNGFYELLDDLCHEVGSFAEDRRVFWRREDASGQNVYRVYQQNGGAPKLQLEVGAPKLQDGGYFISCSYVGKDGKLAARPVIRQYTKLFDIKRLEPTSEQKPLEAAPIAA